MIRNRNFYKTEKRCGSKRMQKLASAVTLVVAGAATAGALQMTTISAPVAQADPANCQTVLWGFLGSQDRTLCDGPVYADGSWMRRRIVWTPAHYVPLVTNCYGGRYYTSCTTTGGYPVDLHVWSDETYPVTPDTVLPDEPGHIEGGL